MSVRRTEGARGGAPWIAIVMLFLCAAAAWSVQIGDLFDGGGGRGNDVSAVSDTDSGTSARLHEQDLVPQGRSVTIDPKTGGRLARLSANQQFAVQRCLAQMSRHQTSAEGLFAQQQANESATTGKLLSESKSGRC